MRPATLCAWLALLGGAGRAADANAASLGTTEPRHGRDTLWYNNGPEPESIDPGLCSDASGGFVIESLFAGLMSIHPKTLAVQPGVATGYQVSDDGLTYTFQLRDSAWSDGVPLTAADFAWSWRRVLDPATASRYASLAFVLARGAAFNAGALWARVGAQRGCPASLQQRLLAAGGRGTRVEADSDGGCLVYPTGSVAEQQAARARLAALAGAPRADADSGALVIRPVVAEDVGVHAVDAHTLVAHLATPAPYFPYLTSFHLFMPVPRHRLTQLAARGVPASAWTRPEHIVSNGPFVLRSWQFRRQFTLAANPRYWDAAHVALACVRALEVENANTALNLYRTGDLDWTGPQTVMPAEFADYLARFDDVERSPLLSVDFYWLNLAAAPLDDVHVRRALALAIDRRALVDYVLRGHQVPTSSLVPAGVGGYRGLDLPLFDPEAARAELRAAGYGPTRPLPPIAVTYNTAESHRQVAEAVQAMWARHLGIEVSLQNQEWKVFVGEVAARRYQVARHGWTGDYPDANTFLHDLLSHDAGNNASGYADLGFDALLTRANACADPQRREALLRAAEARAMAQQPLIPLYVSTRTYAKKPYVRGLYQNPLDRHPLAAISLAPAGAGGAAAR